MSELQTQPRVQDRNVAVETVHDLIKYALINVSFLGAMLVLPKPSTTTVIAVLPDTLLYGLANTDTIDTISAKMEVFGELPRRLERLVAVKFVDVNIKNYTVVSCRIEASFYRVVSVDVVDCRRVRVVAVREPSTTVTLDVEQRDTPIHIDNVIDVVELRLPMIFRFNHYVFTFGLLDDNMYVLNRVTYSKYLSDLPWKLLCGEAYTTSLVARLR